MGVGVSEKNGMRLTGRRKHRNPERLERQTSFLEYATINLFIHRSSINRNQQFVVWHIIKL